MGILAAIAIPRLSGFTEKAELSAKNATLNTVQSAWNIYKAENDASQTWPDDYLENIKSGNETTVVITVNGVDVTFKNTDGVWAY